MGELWDVDTYILMILFRELGETNYWNGAVYLLRALIEQSQWSICNS